MKVLRTVFALLCYFKVVISKEDYPFTVVSTQGNGRNTWSRGYNGTMYETTVGRNYDVIRFEYAVIVKGGIEYVTMFNPSCCDSDRCEQRKRNCLYILEENEQFSFKTELKGNKTIINLVKINTSKIQVTGLKASVRYKQEVIKHFQHITFNDIYFQDCTNTQKYLITNSRSATYNSVGRFYCEQGFKLVPKNANVSTICTIGGTWKENDKVDCVRDPDNFKVTVIGRNDTEDKVIYTNVNESLLLNCESSPSNPPVFSKTYEIYNEKKLTEKKIVSSTEYFQLNVTKENYRNKIRCSNLNKLILPGATKWSDFRTISVNYPPEIREKQISSCDINCKFTFNSNGGNLSANLYVVKERMIVLVDAIIVLQEYESLKTVEIVGIKENERLLQFSKNFQLEVYSSLFQEKTVVFEFQTRKKKLLFVILLICNCLFCLVLVVFLCMYLKRRSTEKDKADIYETIAKEDENVYDEVPLEPKPQKAHGSGEAGCQANRFGCQEDPTGSQETSKDAVFSAFNETKCSDQKCSGIQRKYENKKTAVDKTVCDDRIDQVDKTAAKDWYKVPVNRTNDNSSEAVYVTMNQIKES